ncbi:MAG: cupin domain-containing protein [Pseudomonadota bacterium]
MSEGSGPRIVRYGELIPCRTAFIDAHTPGSDQKENFTIIGAGVTESPHQHIHIAETPGFNIGAAGQPPRCRNSLHAHTTAEVFFVLKGRWRFFWGRWGDAGEVVLEEGDVIDIPTGIFRGFENVGTDYGMIMSVLGGDDAGGGVTWAPQVIEDAKDNGLVLGSNGVIYDTRAGETLPAGVPPMSQLTGQALQAYPELQPRDVVRRFVARYWDLMSLAGKQAATVIGEHGLISDRPGFELHFLTGAASHDARWCEPRHVVLMAMRGHWRVDWDGGDTVLNPGDTCLMEPGCVHGIEPAVSGEASLFRVVPTADPAGSTWRYHELPSS